MCQILHGTICINLLIYSILSWITRMVFRLWLTSIQLVTDTSTFVIIQVTFSNLYLPSSNQNIIILWVESLKYLDGSIQHIILIMKKKGDLCTWLIYWKKNQCIQMVFVLDKSAIYQISNIERYEYLYITTRRTYYLNNNTFVDNKNLFGQKNLPQLTQNLRSNL